MIPLELRLCVNQFVMDLSASKVAKSRTPHRKAKFAIDELKEMGPEIIRAPADFSAHQP